MYLLTKSDLMDKLEELPKANFRNLSEFITSVGDDDLDELISCLMSGEEEKTTYASLVLGAIFMEEYDQYEFREIDLNSLVRRFFRELSIESSYRRGVEERVERDVKLFPVTSSL